MALFAHFQFGVQFLFCQVQATRLRAIHQVIGISMAWDRYSCRILILSWALLFSRALPTLYIYVLLSTCLFL